MCRELDALNAHSGVHKASLHLLLDSLVDTRNQLERKINTADSEDTANGGHHYHRHQQQQQQQQILISEVLALVSSMRERVRRLVSLAFDIHFESVVRVSERLEALERALAQRAQCERRRDATERQPLMPSSSSSSSSPSSATHLTANGGDPYEQAATVALYASVLETCERALSAAGEFVNVAARSLHWPLRLGSVTCEHVDSSCDCAPDTQDEEEEQAIDKRRQRVEIIQADEKLIVYFYGLSRLGGLLKLVTAAATATAASPSPSGNANANGNSNGNNSGVDSSSSVSSVELYLRLSVCFAGRVIDSALVRLDKLDKCVKRERDPTRAADFIVKPHRVQFDRVSLCLMPREATLLVQLCTSAK